MRLVEDLFCYAREIGIDLIGVTSAEPFPAARQVLADRGRRGLSAPFAPRDLDRACDPALSLPGARSIIAVGLLYYQGQLPPSAGHRGKLARIAWGEDYHRVVGEKLALLQDFLRREVPGSRNLSFVDTGPLLDKEVARRAGLGWFGKNTLLLTCLGSWVVLGEILTTVDLPPTPPQQEDCGACDLCLRACPTGALVAPGVLDPGRCLSCLTQGKGYFPRELRPALGLRLYGCDTCQKVCPRNDHAPATAEPAFFPRGQEHRPRLAELLAMNNREFMGVFGASAAGWRGRTVLQRNALVAAGNLGVSDLYPVLADCLQDPRPVIRGHAAWALGRLEDKRARRALERALTGEGDSQVQGEIRLALAGTA
ncbi:MAG TPA: tRNA epoxyqueuosine(34) reductase QueG [Firmicutes bacterium]|nr:tRNA epoxyqueuosine(34) reductase QueG [Bacillota bacterium]